MCNISLLYFNRGFEKGYKEGVCKARLQIMIEMFKNNIPIQSIADVVHLSVEETEKIISDNT